MKDKKIRNSGIGLVSILTLISIVLKLTNNINWSWIWVLSPIWISAILITIPFIIIMIAGRIKRESGNKKTIVIYCLL